MSVAPPHAIDTIISQLRAPSETHRRVHFTMLKIKPNNPATVRIRKVLRNLIDAYRDMPHLWDRKNKDYFNKSLRNQDFRKLTEIYKEAESDATIYTVRRKIDNLRNVYMRELKKVKASQLAASDPQDVYEPALWHYKHMNFLETVMDPQLGQPMPEEGEKADVSTVEVKTEDDPLDSEVSENYLSCEFEEVEDDGETSSHSIQPETSSVAKVVNADDSYHDDIIGKSIGVQLKNVSKKQRVIALKLISDAIYYANLGKLRESSFIQLQ